MCRQCPCRRVFYILGILLSVAVTYYVLTKMNAPPEPGSGAWTYENQDSWPGICQNGTRQSPIALRDVIAVVRTDIPPLHLEHIDKDCDCLMVKTTRRTVKVKHKDDCHCPKPKLSGGDLNQTYKFANFHFHWPSEHTIDHKSYALEGHYMFYADKLESFKKAIYAEDSIAIIAVLYTKGDTTSSHFRKLADAVIPISETADSSIEIKTVLNINDFLPENRDSFYVYPGSFSTPTCMENVRWFVFDTFPMVSRIDVRDLSNVYYEENKVLISNNRKLQEINDRIVYYRKAH